MKNILYIVPLISMFLFGCSSVEQNIQFNSKEYRKVFTLPQEQTDEYKTESYEWVTDNETAETWTTLFTTHKIMPIKNEDLLHENYAQAVAKMQIDNGASLLETSKVNTPEYETIGVDINNPPLLLVYIFEGTENGVELNIQKIESIEGGAISAIVYSERILKKSAEEIETYLNSDEFAQKRLDLIVMDLPY